MLARPADPQRPGPRNRWAILIAMMALGLSAATLIRTLYWSGPKLSKEAAEHERQIQSAIEKAESESAQQSRGGATPVNPDDGRAYPSEVAKKR